MCQEKIYNSLDISIKESERTRSVKQGRLVKRVFLFGEVWVPSYARLEGCHITLPDSRNRLIKG